MAYDLRGENFTFKYVSEKNPVLNEKLVRDHFHAQYELLFVMKGSGIFSIQQNKYNIFPGCLLVVKPGMYHHVNIDDGFEYERIVVRFNNTSMPKELTKNLDECSFVYNIRGTRLAEEFQRFQIYYDDITKENLLLIFQNQLSIILAYLMIAPGIKVQADYKDKTVARVVSYIDKNLVEIDSVEKICKDLRISKSLIQKRFYEHMKTSVMAYVRTQKCMMARTLIQNGFPATFACIECGIGDYSSFYRAYKKVFGQSPADTLRMKNKHRGKIDS